MNWHVRLIGCIACTGAVGDMGSWLMLVGVAGGEQDRTPSVQVMSPLPGGRLHCVISYGRCVPIAVRLAANCSTLLTLPLPLPAEYD